MTTKLEFQTISYPIGSLGNEASVPAFLGNLTFQNEVKFDLDETDEIFEAYRRTASCYPYRELTTYTHNFTEKDLHTIVLDNGHLRAVFLPDFGGRLWSLYDYDHDKNLLYTNDVICYSNLAIRNAWFSGGVEWNIGIIGHSPLTTEPMNVAFLKNERNEPILRMYQYERIRNLEYQMDFWLDAKDSDHYLNCRMRVVNSGSQTVPMYWWSNMAVPEYPHGRVAVPAKEAFTCGYADGQNKVYKTPFPLPDQPDISYYHNIGYQVDYFFNIAKESPKYIANFDENGCGLLHISTDRLRGRKLFSWGQNDGSARWQEHLTNKAGRYVEIQAGLAQTQYGCLPMPAHSAWEWAEQYSFGCISPDICQMPYDTFHHQVTEQVKEIILRRELPSLLPDTLEIAKTKAKPESFGASYATLTNHIRRFKGERSLSPHLEYAPLTEEPEKWLEFLKTGTFPSHTDISKAPGEFQCDEIFYQKLKETIHNTVNQNNWYAHYHLGLLHMYHEDYERAQAELKESLSLTAEHNPWVCHALAVLFFKEGEFKLAGTSICAGCQNRLFDLSYMKEAFRILLAIKDYKHVLSLYKELPKTLREEARMRYDCLIASAHHQPETQKDILKELEQSDFFVDDIREGDDALGEFYGWLYLQVHKNEPSQVPHHLNYHSLK